jgi:hypothetical protein
MQAATSVMDQQGLGIVFVEIERYGLTRIFFDKIPEIVIKISIVSNQITA